MAILDEISDAIKASGMTHYQICKGADVDQAALSRFARGKQDLSLPSVERIAEFLGYEVALRRIPKSRRPK